MKYNFSQKIKIKKLKADEKSSIWSSVVFGNNQRVNKKLSFNFNINMIGAILSLVLLLGGGGAVAAANNAVPGDTLFGLDLALEKAKIAVSSNEKKDELRVRFAEERIREAEDIVKKQSSVLVSEADLSATSSIEIEIDVFTNETTVKVEADDKKYGFITDEKDRDDILVEVKNKYNLSDEDINNAVISFEVEDRDSRADDKKYLNSFNSVSFKSPKQQREFEGSLSEVGDMITNSNLSDQDKAKLGSALAGIMLLLEENPNLDLEIKTKEGMKIEVEDGKIEVKTNNGKNDDRDNDDDDSKDDSDDSDDSEDDNGDDSDDDSDGDSNDDDDNDDDNDSDDDDDNDNGRGRGRGGDDDEDDN
jgi:cold shock CspA family protein